MIWAEVEEKYGKPLADKMKQSNWLEGITLTMRDTGETEIPESDIDNAYRDVTGKRIEDWMWD